MQPTIDITLREFVDEFTSQKCNANDTVSFPIDETEEVLDYIYRDEYPMLKDFLREKDLHILEKEDYIEYKKFQEIFGPLYDFLENKGLSYLQQHVFIQDLINK